jgi:N-acetylmuramoyl-L-alanine amidase
LYVDFAVLVTKAANMQITNGWATGTQRRPSPNFEPASQGRECIVVHYTAGYTAASAIATFAAPSSRASAHFVVETDGAITQMVNCNHTAWHAGFGLFHGRGQVNQRSIGIEIVNPGYHFRSADGRIRNWQRKPVHPPRLAPFPGMIEAHDPWVGSAPVLWPTYPEAQLLAVEALIRACLRAYPTLAEVVGHRDVDTARRRKVDPGPAFPMDRMRRILSDRQAETGADDVLVVDAPTTPLNFRSGPGTRFARLGHGPLAHGTRVTRLEVRGDWVRVRVGAGPGAVEGWCHGAHLKRPTI